MNIYKAGSEFIKLLIRIPCHILYLVSGFIPRNSNIWIFGCWEGNHFRGNSRLFFEYIVKHHSSIRSVWISKNLALVEQLKHNKVKIYYAYSFMGILLSMRAKYGFVSHGLEDINQYLSRKLIIFNLSHATYPIKKMGRADKHNLYFNPLSFKKKLYHLINNPYGYIKPDFLICSSDFTARVNKGIYNVQEESIVVTGLPKSDLLLADGNDDKYLNNTLLSNIASSKIILFLPTYRDSNAFNLFKYDFDANKLEHSLERIDAFMILNLHPFDKSKTITFNNDNLKRLIYCDYVGDEINILLKKASILVTDFSSLWADYLLLDRPIIFAKYDMNLYLKERDLNLNYDNDLPGPKVNNWNELINELEKIFIKNIDSFQKKRIDVKNTIYKYSDPNSCERLFNFIQDID